MTEIRFLGRGAAFYPAYGNTAAFFTAGDELFFLDFGESVFARAARLPELASCSRATVLLTHLHADHAGSLPTFCSYMGAVLKKPPVRVVYPDAALDGLFRAAGVSPACFEHLTALPQGERVAAEAVPVFHVPGMACFGYRVAVDGETPFYWGGDAHRPPEAVLDDLRAGKLGRLYLDVSARDLPAHCGYDALCGLVPRELRGRVTCMHLDGDYADTLEMLGFSVAKVG